MKRDLALLLTAVSLTFALTACGGDDKDVTDPAPDTGSSITGDTTTPENNDTLGDDIQEGVNDVERGVDDVIDDVTDPLIGEGNGTTNSTVTQSNRTGGVSYGDML